MPANNDRIIVLKKIYTGNLLFVSILGPASLFSQTKDSSAVKLEEIPIISTQNKQFTAGKKIQRIDSLTKSNFDNANLGDVLSVNSPVFVRNYGPGNISTSSFRGGNASQTAVLWNGFNIQNNMLGQNDLSQVPNFIFDDINIEYGGSASVWGSGAMGGSIQLNNKPKFNKGVTTSLGLGVGSYHSRKLNTYIHYSAKKFSSTTKAYLNFSDNNFEYLDTVVKRQTHSNYDIRGFLQEFSFLIAKQQKLTVRGWYNASHRNYPPALGNKKSSSSQTDENIKLTADWIYEGRKITPAFRFAYFDDVLNYTDSSLNLFSNSRIKTIIAEADANYLINSNHKLYFGSNYTTYTGISNNYSIPADTSGKKSFNKQALLLGYHFNYFGQKLQFDLSVRQEFSSAFQIPLTGNTGISFQVLKQLKLKANAAKVYRLPTLNDLYWNPGGNRDLKPEDGYTYEGSFELKIPFRNFLLETEMTYFNKNISNWIQWIPAPGGNSTPVNLLKVYSRGTETSSGISYLHKKLKCKLGFNSAYVLSTSQQSILVNDAALNKQLIYTPRYNYGGSFNFTWERMSLSYYHNYIGYRFTASDNSSWLKPYQLANLKIAYSYNFDNWRAIMAFHINNLYNASYMIIAQRPMPLRTYEVSITINYNKPNKEKPGK